jgi:trk system potassium uptake protein TrkA
MELQLRQKYNVNLVLIKRGDETKARGAEKEAIIHVPMPDTMIYKGDVLMVAGSDADLTRLPQE